MKLTIAYEKVSDSSRVPRVTSFEGTMKEFEYIRSLNYVAIK